MSSARRKRPYGTGSVRQRGDLFEIALPRALSGATQAWEPVGRASQGFTRQDAERCLMQRLLELDPESALARLAVVPFETEALAWLKREQDLDELVEHSMELIEIAVHCHLIPAFRDVTLEQLTPELVEEYIYAKREYAPGEPKALEVAAHPKSKFCAAAKYGKPLSRRSINHHLNVLSQICKHAVRKGRMAQDPVALIEQRQRRRRGKKHNPSKPEPLEREEVRSILLSTRDDEEELQVLLLVSLGLRDGELLSLYDTDYHVPTQTLRIRRTQTKVRGRTIISKYGPKNDAGHRDLLVSDEIDRRIMRQLARVRARPAPRNGKRLLFCNTVGNVHTAANFRNRTWKRALEKAGLWIAPTPENKRPKQINPHRLRHTAASEMIIYRDKNGDHIDDIEIARRLGMQLQTLRQTYAHFFKGARRNVSDIAVVFRYDDDAEDEGDATTS